MSAAPTPAEIIRTWCASCGYAAPSNGDCLALERALIPPTDVDWLGKFEDLLEDYVGARAETAVFNVTQRSMTVRLTRPRREALMAHIGSIAPTHEAQS